MYVEQHRFVNLRWFRSASCTTPFDFVAIMARSRKDKTRQKAPEPAVEIVDITVDDLSRLMDRIEQRHLQEGDYELLLKVLRSYDYVMGLLKQDRVKLNRLKRLLFGRTETLDNVCPDSQEKHGTPPNDASGDDGSNGGKSVKKLPRKGHGRNGADEYTEAEQECVEHDAWHVGDTCPECGDGTLYELPPQVVVRVSGQPPIRAKVYRLQRLRCKMCGHLFHASAPAEARGQKYDETAAAMIALLKYGSGLPFNRLSRLEASLGTPLPPSTQWQVVAAYLPMLHPVYTSLIRETAGWDLFHNDDTSIKILQQLGIKEPPSDSKRSSKERTGTFTSTVIARKEGRDAALFFSSRRHAGENLREVLRHRPDELVHPVQMCDALSRNTPDDLQTIVANCLAHARRNFVDVVNLFPEEVEYVLEALAAVYRVEAEAKKKKLTPQKRLKLHRVKSRQVMDRLHRWLVRQFDDRVVEPNSGLGQAITYMLNHWDKLTLFLRVAGAPLDNNIAERSLKKAILHRKNSLYYRSVRGALAGDIYMTLIHTCELNRVNPYKYLAALMRHSEEVEARPQEWLPWTYRDRAAELDEAAEPSGENAAAAG